MKLFCSFLVLVFSLLAYGQQDQKLEGGKWAYYGEEFYTILNSTKKFDRTTFNKIFNASHRHKKGKFDDLTGDCKQGESGCYRHVSVGYDRARKIMFGELDKQVDEHGTYVVDVYCGKKFYFESLDEVSRMHERVNIEHTWPQSRFNGNFPKDMQKSDMHHLFLTDSKANSVRGNTPFGFIKLVDNRDESGCSLARNGFIDGREVYTPPVGHRGNVARALFYFAMRYNLGISNSEERTLRQWHKDDPVDEAERIRHEKIAKHQKVRNPFVDHPEIVDRIADF